MADELGELPAVVVERRLERKHDAERSTRSRELADAAAPPRPHLWRDVVEDRDAERAWRAWRGSRLNSGIVDQHDQRRPLVDQERASAADTSRSRRPRVPKVSTKPMVATCAGVDQDAHAGRAQARAADARRPRCAARRGAAPAPARRRACRRRPRRRPARPCAAACAHAVSRRLRIRSATSRARSAVAPSTSGVLARPHGIARSARSRRTAHRRRRSLARWRRSSAPAVGARDAPADAHVRSP